MLAQQREDIARGERSGAWGAPLTMARRSRAETDSTGARMNASGINHGMRSYYGAQELNGLSSGGDYHAARNENGPPETVDWATPGLKVTRLRLLSDPGFPLWDVSYCHGVLDGKPVDVALPFDQLPKRGWKRFLVEQAIRHNVFAKRLGILDAVSTLQ